LPQVDTYRERQREEEKMEKMEREKEGRERKINECAGGEEENGDDCIC
jgi:hypothetical protein